MNEKEKTKDERTVSFLIQQLQKADVLDDPLQTLSCLYMLKTTVSKSVTPRLAFWCIEHDIVPILMQVLGREFKPREGNEAVVYTLALETLWLLSTVGQPTSDSLLSTSGLFKLLAQFLDTDSNFYQFQPAFQRCLSRLCSNTLFLQQRITAVSMTDKIWNDLLVSKPSMQALNRVRPSHLHHCHLTCKKEEKTNPVVHVASCLIEEGLAWPQPPQNPASSAQLFKDVENLTHPHCDTAAQSTTRTPLSLLRDDDNADNEHAASDCEDVYVLDVIWGPYFWACVGEKAINSLSHITDVLHKAMPSLQAVRHPGVGEVVAVLVNKGSKNAAVRGRVLVVCDEDEVMVFAMDYGSIVKVKVSDVYQLPSESTQRLSAIEAQAKLCCLAGVQAPPASVSAVEFALATLTNLTHKRSKTDVKVVEVKSLDHLYTLLTCGPPNIRLQALRVLCNVSCVPQLSASINWTRFIPPLLGTLVQLSGMRMRQELDNVNSNMAVVTLFTLTNVMHRQPANHQCFFILRGNLIVLNLFRVMKRNNPVKQAAIRMLKTVYPGVTDMSQHDDDSEAEEKTPPRKVDSMVQVLTAARVKPRRGGVLSGDNITNMMQAQTPPQLKKEMEKKVDNALQKKSSLVPTPTTATTDGNVATGKTAVSQSAKVVPVDGVSDFRKSARFYVHGEKVAFCDDQTHHTLPHQSIHDVTSLDVLRVVSGMLNSSGGTIYVGITKEGLVRGLRLTRVDRDGVRLGVDQMMSGHIAFNQLHVHYVQVMGREVDGRLKPDRDNVVIEIHVKASEELHFLREQCLYRDGPVNRTLNEQEVQELVMRREESKYLPLVEALQQQVRRLQAEKPV
ncbi:uncharacterized protein LOC143275967 isoform X2 [Babylonia areolata]|uniref:uncharacterized protein LOC143275967 isoform X2 n=1 Tax=Babylonia areolata TaxID=304850 RepID=UPI003FD331AC